MNFWDAVTRAYLIAGHRRARVTPPPLHAATVMLQPLPADHLCALEALLRHHTFQQTQFFFVEAANLLVLAQRLAVEMAAMKPGYNGVAPASGARAKNACMLVHAPSGEGTYYEAKGRATAACQPPLPGGATPTVFTQANGQTIKVWPSGHRLDLCYVFDLTRDQVPYPVVFAAWSANMERLVALARYQPVRLCFCFLLSLFTRDWSRRNRRELQRVSGLAGVPRGSSGSARSVSRCFVAGWLTGLVCDRCTPPMWPPLVSVCWTHIPAPPFRCRGC